MGPVPSSDVYEEIVAEVRRKFSLKPKVAIAGFGNSGKSSLFNALYGETAASVSMRTDETEEAQTRERFGIDFTDTPGIGTSRFSLEKVIEMGVLEGQHLVIHTLNGVSAITAEDESLHQAIERSSAARITVVNKCDLMDERERSEFAQSVQEKLGLPSSEVLFISARSGEGLPALVEVIVNRIPDATRDAFIGQQQADVAIKERRVRQLVYGKSAVCAAVALAPIPIADILVISPIQVAMVTTIGHLHGVELTTERVTEFIATVAAGVGLREATRQLIKLVPGYGSAVSAAVAFAGTVALGEAANAWFKNKMSVDETELRRIFQEAASEARERYEAYSATSKELGPQVESLKQRLGAGEISQEEYERLLTDL